ncbi:Methyl-accepting chemotaxis protein PctC [Vibrio ruber DSM 16370]|uniref:Methyl-accepting chemotaxis protein PctC n=1 Tax=Vibrio ruber (strain DSM 16370 / JCM 11486 / BCRC 17186 / CECT 7878 / LMG 23124 / VR1) TaxID=1123498 RepID=A0A1R4LNC1_VIBR1|nr:methyl-accepting chemotaxis protein [Vibrio ruber]SJN57774.1 Methyl-accepting chemotaxis protein PctC [Vibrio ruber DSM 16370]
MGLFSGWKIKYQIFTPIAFLLIAILTVSALGLKVNHQITQNTKMLTEYLSPATATVLNADRDLYQSAVALRNYIYLSSQQRNPQKQLDEYHDNQQQAYDRMLASRKLGEAAGIKLIPQEHQTYINAFNGWKNISEKIISFVNNRQYEQANVVLTEDQEKMFSELRIYYDQFGEKLEERRRQVAAEIHHLEAQQQQYTTVACLVSVVIGLWFLFYIPRLISTRLQALTDKMKELSQSGGDLTIRLPDTGNNELSLLAKATNEFITYLHNMLLTIENEVSGIHHHASQLKSLTSKTGTSAAHQNAALDDIAHSISELNTAISEVAQQSQRSSDESNHARTDVTNSHQGIQNAIHQITELVQEMEGAASVISKLEQDSQSINSVVDVIRGIAEQTNLLALNAAIEAARAGDSGRGFAVVADEVRALAQKTQESTQSIQTTLSELNAGVQKAVDTIKSGTEKAVETSGYTDSAGSAMNLIIERVNSITDFSVQIAAATEEQSVVVNQVNSNMEQMRESSKEVTVNASEANNAISEVTLSIQKLSQQVASFKLS